MDLIIINGYQIFNIINFNFNQKFQTKQFYSEILCSTINQTEIINCINTKETIEMKINNNAISFILTSYQILPQENDKILIILIGEEQN